MLSVFIYTYIYILSNYWSYGVRFSNNNNNTHRCKKIKKWMFVVVTVILFNVVFINFIHLLLVHYRYIWIHYVCVRYAFFSYAASMCHFETFYSCKFLSSVFINANQKKNNNSVTKTNKNKIYDRIDLKRSRSVYLIGWDYVWFISDRDTNDCHTLK